MTKATTKVRLILILTFALLSSVIFNYDFAKASNYSNQDVQSVNVFKIVNVKGGLILRSIPDVKAKKTAVLKYGSQVYVYSTNNNGWSLIKQGKLKGYVLDKNLTIKTLVINKSNGFGTLRGTVTWQYNKYIGTKPDVGAKIFVIPNDFNHNSVNIGVLSSFAIGVDTNGDNLFIGEANGYGEYQISDIPVGKYFVLISSRKTTRNPYEPIHPYLEQKLTYLLGSNSYKDFADFNLKFPSHEYKIIEIEKDKTKDFSNDFGYTYF